MTEQNRIAIATAIRTWCFEHFGECAPTERDDYAIADKVLALAAPRVVELERKEILLDAMLAKVPPEALI